MLPDFPDIKNELNEIGMDFIREHSKESDPVLGMIGTTIQHEGNKGSYETVDGEEIPINYDPFEGVIEIPFSEAFSLSLNDYFEKLKPVALSLAYQMSKNLYRTLNDACEKAETITNNKGQPLTFESYLEALRKVQIDFDDVTGKPKTVVVTSPTLMEECKRIMPEWQRDEDKKKILNELFESKFKEWHEREARRKLVD